MKIIVKHQKHLIFLGLIFTFLMGLVLRVFLLDSLPSEMHRDEASIAYNAYSLLKTGKEEHGIPWPLTFPAFGDNKLPGIVYLTMTGFKLFGVSVFTARLSSTIISSLLILIAFGIIHELFKNKKMALVTSLIVSLSIWHTFLSRTIYEPTVGLSLSSLSILFFLKSRKKRWWLFLSVFFYGVSLFFYNAPLLLLPLIFSTGFGIFKDDFFGQHKNKTFTSIALFILVTIVITTLLSGNITERSKTTFIGNNRLHQETDQIFSALIQNHVSYKITTLVSSKYLTYLQTFVKGYFSAFNIEYLFFEGGNNPWHSLGILKIGNLNWAILPLIIIFIWLIGLKKSSKAILFLVSYLLISPFANAVTVDAPNTNRLLDFHFALLLIAGYSFYTLVFDRKINILLKKKNKHFIIFQKVCVFVIFGCFIFSWFHFVTKYFFIHHSFMSSSWYPGLSKAIQYSQKYKFDRVYIDIEQIDQGQLSYANWLFLTQHDPQNFHRNAHWNTYFVFKTPSTFHPYYFKDTPQELKFNSDQTNQLFPDGVDTAVFVTALRFEKPSSRESDIVYDDQGHPIWQVTPITKKELILSNVTQQ